MNSLEILVVSNTAGLSESLQGYDGLLVSQFPSLARVRSILASDQPPAAVYLEDTRGTIAELWEVITVAQSKRLRVLVGLQSVGLMQKGDFESAGLAVSDARDAGTLASWIAEQLGARPRASASGLAVYVFSGAKGGIGKTQAAASCAIALGMRGARVLMVDGDLSNSGLKPTFKIGSDAPSYLYLKGDGMGAFTAANVRRYIYKHEQSGIDFLLGSDEADGRDMTLGEWQALTQAVRSFSEYDVVILDTGPDLKKRPYAINAALAGGWVVLPTLPGLTERTGVGNALNVFAAQTPSLLDRCFLLYIDPEKGVTVEVKDIAPLFAQNWPAARPIGILPRAARQISIAKEAGDQYVSPLSVAPHSRYSRAIHHAVDTFAALTGLRLTQPMPKSSLWQQLRGEKIATFAPVAADSTLPAMPEEVRA